MIYFAQDGNDGPIKIGFSKDPIKRCDTLRWNAKEELVLLVVTEGGKPEEARIHKMFAEIRIDRRREWFWPDKRLLDYIESAAAGCGPIAKFPRRLTENGGRPPLSGERKSDTPLRIRLTKSERKELDDAARANGKPTSTWLRDILLEEARKINEN